MLSLSIAAGWTEADRICFFFPLLLAHEDKIYRRDWTNSKKKAYVQFFYPPYKCKSTDEGDDETASFSHSIILCCWLFEVSASTLIFQEFSKSRTKPKPEEGTLKRCKRGKRVERVTSFRDQFACQSRPSDLLFRLCSPVRKKLHRLMPIEKDT